MASVVENYLDHRIIFVAACSSFLTLWILSIINKFNYIKYNYYKNKQAELLNSIKTNAMKSNENNNNNDNDIDGYDDISEFKQQEPIASKSLISSICTNMITDEHYIHQKTADYFESDTYRNLIPQNASWINNKIRLLIKDPSNYSEHFHQIMLDNFDVSSFESSSNKYYSEILHTINLFNKWRKLPNSLSGWKLRTTKNAMKVYTHTLPKYDLDAVRVDTIFPFKISVCVGVLLSKHHLRKMDPAIQTMDIVDQPSLSSTSIYLGIKFPPFIANRDFVNIATIYIFKDGSILVGTTCMNNNENIRKNNKYIRGKINLSMYHMRPCYDGNLQHTKVSFYSHVMVAGSIPSFVLNAAYMEVVKSVTNYEAYIKSNIKNLYKLGKYQLNIPPNPFLRMMNIPIQ